MYKQLPGPGAFGPENCVTCCGALPRPNMPSDANHSKARTRLRYSFNHIYRKCHYYMYHSRQLRPGSTAVYIFLVKHGAAKRRFT